MKQTIKLLLTIVFFSICLMNLVNAEVPPSPSAVLSINIDPSHVGTPNYFENVTLKSADSYLAFDGSPNLELPYNNGEIKNAEMDVVVDGIGYFIPIRAYNNGNSYTIEFYQSGFYCVYLNNVSYTDPAHVQGQVQILDLLNQKIIAAYNLSSTVTSTSSNSNALNTALIFTYTTNYYNIVSNSMG